MNILPINTTNTNNTKFNANLKDMKKMAKGLNCPFETFYYLKLANRFKRVEKAMKKNNIKVFVLDLIQKDNDIPKVLQDVYITKDRTFKCIADSTLLKNELNMCFEQSNTENPLQLVFNAKTLFNFGKKFH